MANEYVDFEDANKTAFVDGEGVQIHDSWQDVAIWLSNEDFERLAALYEEYHDDDGGDSRGCE